MLSAGRTRTRTGRDAAGTASDRLVLTARDAAGTASDCCVLTASTAAETASNRCVHIVVSRFLGHVPKR